MSHFGLETADVVQVDGFHSVQARIAGIQQRFEAPPVDTAAAAAAKRAPTRPTEGGVFDRLMTEAIGGTPTSARTPATKLTPGAYSRLEPPAELRAYGNGKIPEDALSEIGVGQHRLSTDAAEAFRQMTADAAQSGVDIGVTDSYRSYDAQVDVAERKGLYSQGGLAATPGTSNHGWGLALDLDLDSPAQTWMRENAAAYGFVEDVPREPWHWTYRPDQLGAGFS